MENWMDMSRGVLFFLLDDTVPCGCTAPGGTRPIRHSVRSFFRLTQTHMLRDHFVHLKYFVMLCQWLMRYVDSNFLIN
jgi:hypothetical protein